MGMKVRLSTTPGSEIAAPANTSPNHVGRIGRWLAEAQEANPQNTPEENARLAEQMRTDYFTELGRRSAVARAAKRNAPAA
jgi:hypothetical protein